MEKSCLKLGVDDLGERESDIEAGGVITTLERRAALSPSEFSRCSVMSSISTELTRQKEKRPSLNLQPTQELIKHCDSILAQPEGECQRVNALLTGKFSSSFGYSGDTETITLVSNSTRRLTAFGKSTNQSALESKSVQGVLLHEGKADVRAKGLRSTSMFGRSSSKLSAKFDNLFARLFCENMPFGAMSCLVVRLLLYKDDKIAKKAENSSVRRKQIQALGNLRLKSCNNISFEHDSEAGVDYITISNVYEDEKEDNEEPDVILKFHDRRESKVWLDKLNLALAGIHASRVIADTNWMARESSFNYLMKKRHLGLDNIIMHARHGNDFENALRMVKAHTFFLEKRLTMEEREDDVEGKKNRRSSSPVVADL